MPLNEIQMKMLYHLVCERQNQTEVLIDVCRSSGWLHISKENYITFLRSSWQVCEDIKQQLHILMQPPRQVHIKQMQSPTEEELRWLDEILFEDSSEAATPPLRPSSPRRTQTKGKQQPYTWHAYQPRTDTFKQCE